MELGSSASPGTIVDQGSGASRANERLHQSFGDEPIVIQVRARKDGCPGGRDCRLLDLVVTPDWLQVLALEGCLSGNAPRGAKLAAPVCREFRRERPFAVVNGPGTFINESVRQVSSRIRAQRSRSAAQAERAAEAARKVAAAQGRSAAEQERLALRARELAELRAIDPALRYGLSPRGPGVADPTFLLELLFEPSLGFDVPKTRFAHIFPSGTSALIQARPRPGLSEAELRRAIDLVRQTLSSRSFKLDSADYVMTGAPVVEQAVESSIAESLWRLLAASVLLVSIALALAFRARLRLGALLPALAATAVVFGMMGLAGASVTIASIAIVPVLLGLSAGQAAMLWSGSGLSAGEDIRGPRAAAVVFGTLAAVAALALVALSPVPMVRTFGAFVALGLILSLPLTYLIGTALSRLLPDGGRALPPARVARVLRPLLAATRVLARATRDAGARVGKGWKGVRGAVVRHPSRALAVGLATALAGWALAGEIPADSRLERLAPADLSEVENARALQRESGVSGDVSVVVRARDLAAPSAISWMVGYQKRVLARHGFSERRVCRSADLCPALLLGTVFGSGRVRNRTQGERLLATLPPYFAQGLLSRDRRTARISFSISSAPLEEQEQVIDVLRDQLDPPAGVSAELAGPAVAVADANARLGSSRWELTLAALAAAFLVLFALYRRRDRAGLPLLPVALATGWSALLLLVLGITLNPLSATLGVLVVAAGTQFSVVLADGYWSGRAAGAPPGAALERGYERSASALRAWTVVLLGGMLAAITSDVRIVRDFGVAAALDLALVLAGVALLLPAVLVLSEGRDRLRLPRSRAELAAAARRAAGSGRRAAREVRRRLGTLGPALRQVFLRARRAARAARRS